MIRIHVAFALAISLSAVAPLPASADGDFPDALLFGFHGAKLGLATLAAGTALTDPEANGAERAILGGGALLVALPSTLVLIEARTGRAEPLRRWRIAAFVVDAGLSATAAVYGAWLIGGPDSSLGDQYAGLACLSAGLLGALLSGLDLVPFALERRP